MNNFLFLMSYINSFIDIKGQLHRSNTVCMSKKFRRLSSQLKIVKLGVKSFYKSSMYKIYITITKTVKIKRKVQFYVLHSSPAQHNTCTYTHPRIYSLIHICHHLKRHIHEFLFLCCF